MSAIMSITTDALEMKKTLTHLTTLIKKRMSHCILSTGKKRKQRGVAQSHYCMSGRAIGWFYQQVT
jgi:hypothetical protein